MAKIAQINRFRTYHSRLLVEQVVALIELESVVIHNLNAQCVKVVQLKFKIPIYSLNGTISLFEGAAKLRVNRARKISLIH